MRFIHLAPRSAIGRILRSGLRLGDGRRGKGIYAVPLFRIRRITFKRRDSVDRKDIDFSVPLSSATLWRDLFGGSRRHRGRRPIAVVFDLPSNCWPVDVYLEVGAANAGPLLRSLRRSSPKGLHVSAKAMEFVSSAAAAGFISDLEARAANTTAVGFLLRQWLASGASAWSRYDETVEVVIRGPVPETAVRRLVPLSRTNVKARARRERQKGLSDFGDDA